MTSIVNNCVTTGPSVGGPGVPKFEQNLLKFRIDFLMRVIDSTLGGPKFAAFAWNGPPYSGSNLRWILYSSATVTQRPSIPLEAKTLSRIRLLIIR